MSKPCGTILVVDDSTTMRNVIKKILEPVGYAVLEAKNGIEALTMALSDSPPDLITLDVDMPKMDGFSACRKILSDYHENGVSLTREKAAPYRFRHGQRQCRKPAPRLRGRGCGLHRQTVS